MTVLSIPDILKREDPLYPSSDGKPMAENTEQYRWIVLIAENLQAIFQQDPNVFIAADLLWYAVKIDDRVEDQPICQAPDTMVVFGRPKGFRMSYRQWMEENIPPQVVFEILSQSNKTAEGRRDLQKKFEFYQRHGVEEYYTYDPLPKIFKVWQREKDVLVPIAFVNDWVSLRLQVRFEWQPHQELACYRPSGEPFLSFGAMQEKVEQETIRAEQERLQKEFERQEKELERQAKEQERSRADGLAAYLRSLGIDPDQLPPIS
jgi:Uma2 family endonuclease